MLVGWLITLFTILRGMCFGRSEEMANCVVMRLFPTSPRHTQLGWLWTSSRNELRMECEEVKKSFKMMLHISLWNITFDLDIQINETDRMKREINFEAPKVSISCLREVAPMRASSSEAFHYASIQLPFHFFSSFKSSAGEFQLNSHYSTTAGRWDESTNIAHHAIATSAPADCFFFFNRKEAKLTTETEKLLPMIEHWKKI